MSRRYGLWVTARTFVAVCVDASDETGPPLSAPKTEAGYRALLDTLSRPVPVEIVITDEVLEQSTFPLAEIALARGVLVWIAPHALVQGVLRAAGHPRSARRAAGIAARLPGVDAFRNSTRIAMPRTAQPDLPF